MKVDEPKWGRSGLYCEDCPCINADGEILTDVMDELCNNGCPKNIEEYNTLAEAAEKEGR